MARLVPELREMRTTLMTTVNDGDGAWRDRLVTPRRPVREWRRGRASARAGGPPGAMQRLMFLVRVVAVTQAIMRSPIGRRAMALNRKGTEKSKPRGLGLPLGLPLAMPLALPRARRRDRGRNRTFIVGVLVGIAIGVAGAIIYSARRRRDLREERDAQEAGVGPRDTAAIGQRLEARFSAVQAQLEDRIGQVKERAAGGPDVVVETAETVTEAAADAGADAVETVTEAAADAGADAVDTVGEAAEGATAAVEDTAEVTPEA
jgi:hypothetical protein